MLAYSYSQVFSMRRLNTSDLKNKEYLDDLILKGFIWIRQYHNRHFEDIVRNPTVGCIVEVFRVRYPNCVEINSKYGKKLINKLCYF